jgi:ribokinase
MDLIITSPKIPQLGETVLGSGFMTAPGGKGANQAIAASRLGGQVSMIGCLGSDIFGEHLFENLKENHVDTAAIRFVRAATGIAVIVVKEGDNFIIVDPGANSMLTPDMITENEKMIRESDIVMLQLEIPLETVEQTVSLAKKCGAKVLLNPAPARELSDGILSKIDILTPNETECELITGISVKNPDDAKKAVSFLMEKGIPQVIVTMGGAGVVYNRGKEMIHKPAAKVKVTDTTAAGDSFSGAVAVALSQGKTIDEAVDFGIMAGALTVTKKGALESLPTSEEVDHFRLHTDL